ncbi:site-specific integrase [Acidithiobacillus sp.]|uniref:integrase n=1 Tax=Acidithiobacillus sp. TaxID=1872118 RepID=UPI0025BA72E9|nr:site-specific integrase [Acidithiobacillus sp.]
MATITPRKDQDGNVIGYQVHVRKRGYPTQTKTFRRKRDAEAWARLIESEMERGLWRDRSESESTTLEECIQRYLAEVTPGKKNGHPEELRLRQWLRRPIAKRFMSAIRGRDVAETIKDMEGEGKSGNTIRLHLAVLSHLFKVARTEWGMEAISNPVEAVRKPKLPQGRERRLIVDEEARLLEACRQDENPDILSIVQFAIETAMRRAEICGLRWENVNLAGRVALLPDTKNGNARRVPLSSAAVAVLAALPRRLDGLVWDVKADTVTQVFARCCERAGIKDLHFHDLRHEATSRLFEKGFNPMEVSAITGHKTLQMLKRYTHLRAEDLAKRMG